jgi:hypothetical protein
MDVALDAVIIICPPERQFDFQWIAIKYLSGFKFEFASPKSKIDGDGIVVFIKDSVIWMEPNALSKLIERASAEPSKVWIASNVLSERVIYIWQIMAILPPVLFVPWSFEYIDKFRVEHIKPSYYASIYRVILDRDGNLNGLRFPTYSFQPTEHITPYVVATDAIFANGSSYHTFLDQFIVGSKLRKTTKICMTSHALCVTYDPPTAEHAKCMSNTDYLSKYDALCSKSPSPPILPMSLSQSQDSSSS